MDNSLEFAESELDRSERLSGIIPTEQDFLPVVPIICGACQAPVS